jgi:hypothetical protein
MYQAMYDQAMSYGTFKFYCNLNDQQVRPLQHTQLAATLGWHVICPTQMNAHLNY